MTKELRKETMTQKILKYKTEESQNSKLNKEMCVSMLVKIKVAHFCQLDIKVSSDSKNV